jgi:hypothetical protein
MATQYSNKPIVTNGLVYALDFGNPKTYTSGSNRAVSLAYDPTTTIVTGSTAIPSLVNGILNFTGSQYVQRSGSLPTLDPTGSFTISLTALAVTTGSLFSQNLTGKNLGSRITTASSDFGFSLTQGNYSRTIPRTPTTSALQHITYRYSSGTIDTFINGIPVTSSAENSAILTSVVTSSLFINSGSNFFSGSLANFYVYNRALTADEIWSNYQLSATRYGFATASAKPYLIDENLYQWIQSTGTTDTVTISAMSTFISSLKSAGLWNKLQVIYPFVGTTTGSQTINIKEPGLYRLGLTGSFSASSAGLYPSSSTSFVDSISGTTVHPLVNSASAHLSLLSYDLPTGNGFLGGNSARAIGGDLIVSSGSRMYHVYKNVGTSSFAMGDPSITNVEVLAVAGGGGSPGRYCGGGGGAGGLVYSASFTVLPNTPLQVTVGDGGLGYTNGQNSTFSTVTAIGGGAGGTLDIDGPSPGLNGGSGGGGGGRNSPGTTISGSGTVGQGFDGGSGGYSLTSGGGGGAGGSGSNAPGSVGGSGSFYPQFSNVGGSPAGWFAGGGGGVISYNNSGPGGIGGGGTGVDGVLNTGGGAGGYSLDARTNRKGGSGIVIVSYDLPASALTGSGTGLYLTDTAVTGSVNSQFTAGITGSGNIGLLTVSRTGSGTFSLHKNNVSQSIASASLGVLSTDIFFNTANLAGSGSLPLQANLSYASIGAGLTTSEVATYTNLISQLQTNLKRKNTLLDNYTGAAAAYSLRRIGPSGYFGPAIRVRRDSDNTLRDIGFTSDGQLDTVGLLDFVGVTGSGFVQRWYDQSGRGVDLQQTSNASQPYLLLSGSFKNQGPKPSIEFRNDADLQLVSDISSVNSDYSWLYVRSMGPYINAYYFAFNDTPALLLDRPDLAYYQTSPQGTNVSTNRGLLQQYLLSTGASTYQNNTLINSGLTYSQAKLRSGLGNSGMYQFFGYAEGNTQELIIYSGSRLSDQAVMASNMNDYWKIYGSATASFDTDYQAFITATGITQPTQSAALETLVSDLKSYGLWSKMKAIYPMVTDKNNRFAYSQELNTEWNPVNTTVTANNITAPDGTLTAERITETTSSITTYTVTNNGASAYTINGSDNPVLTLERGKTYQFNINASGHPFYIMTGSGAYTAGGQYDTGVTGQGTQVGTLTFVVPDAAPSTLAYVCQFHSSMGNTINVINNTDQHHIYQTIADGLVTGSEYVASIYGKFLNRPWIAVETNAGAKAWFNIQTGVTGSLTGSNATITAVSGGWYRCALYFTSSVASGPKNIEYHLADTNGNLTYAGVLGTGSYLWGAQFENGNLVGPYRATTTVGFTTGSMLDQMKFNLKSTSSFSGSYVGGWNPGYSGNKPDGVTTYMNTNLSVSNTLSTSSTHLGFYSRTNVNAAQFDMSAGTNYMLSLYTNTFYVTLTDGAQNVFTSVPNTLGFYLGSRINNTAVSGYKNTNKIIDNAAQSSITTASTIYIGSRGDGGLKSTKEFAFSTIGDGLTDYEAKALYWIVQKYQTTLGRQVY